MAKVSTSENPAEAQALLQQVLSGIEPETGPPAQPPMADLEETRFSLCGGILLDGKWITDFEVRELTGRDEEILTRSKDDSRFFLSMLELALVSVGGAPANKDTPQYLLAGDWDTVLLAIRIVTFGRKYEYTGVCSEHGAPFTVEIDLRDDIPRRTCGVEDLHYTVLGRTGTRYRVGHIFGSTQQRLFAMNDSSVGEINSFLLAECVSEINGQPMTIPMEQAKNIPLADRRLILREIANKRVGPDLEGVTTQCPECGADQKLELGIASMFL